MGRVSARSSSACLSVCLYFCVCFCVCVSYARVLSMSVIRPRVYRDCKVLGSRRGSESCRILYGEQSWLIPSRLCVRGSFVVHGSLSLYCSDNHDLEKRLTQTLEVLPRSSIRPPVCGCTTPAMQGAHVAKSAVFVWGPRFGRARGQSGSVEGERVAACEVPTVSPSVFY